MGAIQLIGSGIGKVFTDPIGAIKDAWSGIQSFLFDQLKPLLSAIDLIQKGEYLSAAKEIGKAAFNISPAGLAFNAINKVVTSDTVQKAAKDAKDSQIGLPSFLSPGKMTPVDISAFPGSSVANVNQPTLADNDTSEASVKSYSGNSRGGNSIVISIEALMKDNHFIMNDGSDIESVKAKLSKALLEVVQDVEISYSS